MRPIGVFDSGIGGLSVLRALQAELPHERFVYVADNAYAPYGERDDVLLSQRAHAIADYLVIHQDIKALVVACNTATAAAIHTLRAQYTQFPIIGIEPALKPAAAATKTGRVGVMATRATLGSNKFTQLLKTLKATTHFVLQPCDGLAAAIERADESGIQALCHQYTGALGRFGNADGEIDSLVLGCTHYPLIADELLASIGAPVLLLDGGVPVARQTRRLLEQLPSAPAQREGPEWPEPFFYSTGNTALLDSAIQRWLRLRTGTQILMHV